MTAAVSAGETTQAAAGSVPVLKVSGLSKAFPGVQALRDIDFDLRPGEVHCLIGENGAGKSTLVKILAGVLTAEQGEVLIAGIPVAFSSPLAAQDAGIACIFQELNVVGGLTVAENIMLGAEPGPVWLRRPQFERSPVASAARQRRLSGTRRVTAVRRAVPGGETGGDDRQGAPPERPRHHHGRTLVAARGTRGPPAL